MRLDNAQSLKEVIEQWRDSLTDKNKWYESVAVNSWQYVVPRRIAEQTLNIRIKNGVMFVRVDSAAIKQELFYRKRFIVSSLNKRVGVPIVKEIIFN